MADDPSSLAAAAAMIAALRTELADTVQREAVTAAHLADATATIASLENDLSALQGIQDELSALKAIYQAPMPTSGKIDQVMRYRTSDGKLHEKMPDAHHHEALLLLMNNGLSQREAAAVMLSKDKLVPLI